MTADHPDADALADLAADVLPTDLARAVESHVIGCARCAGVLEDAERVRTLLTAAVPGPMPDEIWSRIESALLADAPAAPVTGTQRRVGGTTGIIRRVPSGETGIQEAVGGALPPDRASERTQVLHRPGRIAQPTRRQTRRDTRRDSRTPERLDDSTRSSRLPMIFVAAAALVAVAAVGTLLVRNVHSRDGAGTSAAQFGEPQQRNAAAAALVQVSRTRTDYTTAALAKQVGALISHPPAPVPAAASASSQPSSVYAEGGASGQLLADPKALADCLSALDTPPGTRPLAVDLATFEGRDAAIIVLPARDKGYEVWAVARDCRKGNDGTISYTVVPAQ